MQYRKYHRLKIVTLLCSSLILAACGSGSGSDNNAATNGGQTDAPSTSNSHFSAATQTWGVALPAKGAAACYDIDTDATVACGANTQWDLKLQNPTGARAAPKLWTNSGVTNANGQGGAFGFFTWAELSQWENATTEPSTGTDFTNFYKEDSFSSIFTQQLWYAYNLQGMHRLYPNYNVYLINTNPADASAATYAVQVIGYYGGASGTKSGHMKLRWINTAQPNVVHAVTVDATSYSQWKYVDLSSESVYSAQPTTAWQIAVRRDEIKLNGGVSGNGAVAGYLGREVAGLYDANGEPITTAFMSTTPADTLDELKDTANYTTPGASSGWVVDENGSILSPASEMTGSYPNIVVSYGIYSYQMQGDSNTPAHGFVANPDQAALLRSGAGNSYARFHLTHIQYADVADPNSAQTWTFTFNVQPAP